MELLIWAILSLLGIAAAMVISTRLGIAAPLLLTVAGIVVSLLPFNTAVVIEPEWILSGVLPPLLYSAAVSMPTMEFRRDLTAISGLSIVLVVISSILLGLVFSWLVPGLGLAGGIALGAIISPTDAVAIAIVKRLGVSPRAVAMLEGESLLNDASALVILRTAIAGMAATVSLWDAFGSFLYAVVVAALIGWVIGELNLRVRAWVEDSTVNTIISFTIPFLAALPAEHLGSSGLVAAVVAGLVTGRDAPRYLSPQHRLSDAQNWRTIEMVLEGAVFLIMGLELQTIIQEVQADHLGIGIAIGLAALALLVVILVRATYVAPLLWALEIQSQRSAAIKGRLDTMQQRFADTSAETRQEQLAQVPQRFSTQQIERFRLRLRRQIADINYFLAEPLSWREGSIVVWAGMRGVVTLAAAQTLPATMPNRSLLIFIAFLVAVGSLLLQGGTLPWLIQRLQLAGRDTHASNEERGQLMGLMRQAALKSLDDLDTDDTQVQLMRKYLTLQKGEGTTPDLDSVKRLRLRMLEAQRNVLLDARDNGEFSAEMLSAVLANLDADQISLELKGKPLE